MGNLCSTSKDDDPPARRRDNFAGQGRTLADSAARPANTATPPKAAMGNSQSSAQAGPGHTLADSDAAQPGPRAEADPNMRSAAARAAEERMKKAQGTGALGKKLDAQKKQTRVNTLEEASKNERSSRTQDAAASQQAYN